MTMAAPVTTVHSVAEAYLFVMVRRCAACGEGPVQTQDNLTRATSARDGWTLSTVCAKCKNSESLQFIIEPEPTRTEAASNRINPTSKRSEAIDLLGWLTLYRTIIESAKKQEQPAEMRRLAGEAAQCLDEALKFYEPGDELPPAGAFFSQDSAQRFRDHPQQFARSRWMHERSRLPETSVLTRGSASAGKPPWWKFWKSRN
jgi:hypothetical protein